jgi:transposase
MRTSQKTPGLIATIGIDLGKNTFHLVGFNKRGAIVLQQKVSRAQGLTRNNRFNEVSFLV